MSELKQKVLTLGHVGMGTGTTAPFDVLFNEGMQVTADQIYDGAINCLVIWGGADISPSIYGEPVGPNTGASAVLSYRDKVEVEACRAAIAVGIPIIGVCRGAQLLCAMAGGKLVQDVQGHCNGDHMMTTKDGRSIKTSSVHHQMLYPWDVKHELIAWSSDRRSRTYVGMEEAANHVEPEVVYFPAIKGLAIQGHPEFMSPHCEFVKYCNNLVQEYLL